MLPKRNRILKKSEFQEVLRKGKVAQGRLFGVAIHQSRGDFPKVGIVVSNKISKLAVKRNRARRLLREVIRKMAPGFKNGVWLVFLAKKPIIGAEYKEIEEELSLVLKRTGII